MLKEYLKRIADALRSALGITSVTTYYEVNLGYAEDDTEYANPIFIKTNTVLELTEEQISDLPYYESGNYTTTGEAVYTLDAGQLFVCVVSNIPTINAQDFPVKIAEVYEAGKAEGGNGTVEGLASVTFMNNDVELLTRPVYIGDDCPDPKTQGRIETPTKESTVDTVYTYNGWSLTDGGNADADALKNVTGDRTVYASYAESVRYYTVNFYDGDTLLKTQQVAYGGSLTYTYKKDNYLFKGWSPEPVNVAQDLNCYGVWEESFAFADASWEYIAQMSESGKASEAFAVGDERVEKIGNTSVTLVIADFNYDLLADNSGNTAGITIITKDVYSNHIANVVSNTYGADWRTSPIYTKLTTIFSGFSTELSTVVKSVKKKYRQENTSKDAILTSNEKIWALSAGEVVNSDSYSGLEIDERSQDRVYELFNNQEYIKCSVKWWTRSWNWKENDYRGSFDADSVVLSQGYASNPEYIRFGFCI